MAEAGALPPTIHTAGLNGPQASENRGYHPHPHPASASPPTPEREPAAGSRALARRPRALKGPDPGMAKGGDPEAIPLSEPQQPGEAGAALLTSGASSFPPGRVGCGRGISRPSKAQALPAHLVLLLTLLSPEGSASAPRVGGQQVGLVAAQ